MTQNSQKRSNSQKERVEQGKDRSELDLQLARERVWDVEPFCIRESCATIISSTLLGGRGSEPGGPPSQKRGREIQTEGPSRQGPQVVAICTPPRPDGVEPGRPRCERLEAAQGQGLC